jgi:hypothetical protein
MPVGAGLLLKASPQLLAPADVWLLGQHVSSARNIPIVLYKPAGGAWQIQYDGSGLASDFSASFRRGYRGQHQTAGTIWSAGRSVKNTPFSNGLIQKSTDYGATWTYYNISPTVFNNPSAFGDIVAIDDSTAVCSTEGTTSAIYRLSGGVIAAATGPDVTNISMVSTFIYAPSNLSPTSAEVLKCFVAITSGSPRLAVATSTDSGASWSVETYLVTDPNIQRQHVQRGVAGLSYDRNLFFATDGVRSQPAEFWTSTDSVNWTKYSPGFLALSGGNQIAGGGIRANNKWGIGAGSNMSRTINGGANWTVANPGFAIGRLRFIGDKFYAIATDNVTIKSSADGVTWANETLPSLSAYSSYGFNDVFGGN